MELRYSWWMEDDFYLGYIDEYPQYPTQGESLEDLENGLREIYDWIKDGSLKLKENKGILKTVIRNLFPDTIRCQSTLAWTSADRPGGAGFYSRLLACAMGAVYSLFFTQKRKDAKGAKGEERVVVR